MKHVDQTEFKTPRHARLFELIRQHRVAQNLTTNTANANEERVVSPDFARQFQSSAGRSLRYQAPDQRLSEALRQAI